ncbi:hypothetical protein, partial [Tsukamurella pseudospumae]
MTDTTSLTIRSRNTPTGQWNPTPPDATPGRITMPTNETLTRGHQSETDQEGTTTSRKIEANTE